MKIRKDFVTNSSSASFILARKGKLTKKQKEAIAEFVEDNLLGKPIATTKEELIDYIRDYYGEEAIDDNGNMNDEYFYDTSEWEKAFEALEKGMTIYEGEVSFEDDYNMAALYESLWSLLEEDSDDFIGIDTDLSY